MGEARPSMDSGRGPVGSTTSCGRCGPELVEGPRAVLAISAFVSAWLLTGLPAECGEKRPLPENWPTSAYPAGKPDPGGGEGCRMPMRELIQRYKEGELTVKTAIEDANAHWGTYAVGDDMNFGAAIGPPDSRIFGSVKHGTDGGHLAVTCYWMDEKGMKVLRKSVKTIAAGC